jgi:hypothetical protein
MPEPVRRPAGDKGLRSTRQTCFKGAGVTQSAFRWQLLS